MPFHRMEKQAPVSAPWHRIRQSPSEFPHPAASREGRASNACARGGMKPFFLYICPRQARMSRQIRGNTRPAGIQQRPSDKVPSMRESAARSRRLVGTHEALDPIDDFIVLFRVKAFTYIHGLFLSPVHAAPGSSMPRFPRRKYILHRNLPVQQQIVFGNVYGKLEMARSVDIALRFRRFLASFYSADCTRR